MYRLWTALLQSPMFVPTKLFYLFFIFLSLKITFACGYVGTPSTFYCLKLQTCRTFTSDIIIIILSVRRRKCSHIILYYYTIYNAYN